MSTHKTRYPFRDDKFCIEIKLAQLQQLYSSRDPAPFRDRDLDDDAVEYIVESFKEIGSGSPVKLVIHLPADQIQPSTQDATTQAIHNFFSYEEELVRKKVKTLFKQGQIFFLTGIIFLAVCLSFSYRILSSADSVMPHILGEGLNIIGWVAMWKPIEIFLYDWRPLRRTRQYYRDLAVIEVEIVPQS